MEKKTEKNTFSGIWVPKELLNIGIKNKNQLLLFSMIIPLSARAPCSASNMYFANLLNLSKGQVSRLISKLEEKGFIKVYVDALNANKRSITITKKDYTLYANESTPIRNNEDTLYAQTRTNSIIDNIDINSTTSTAKEKLEINLNLINSCIKDYKIEKEYVLDFINEFINKNEIEEKKVWINDNDLFKHFKSTLAIKIKKEDENKKNIETKEFKLEKELKWFIDIFNKISGRNFKITPEIQKSFTKQFAVGFSGEEMAKAVKNLYSSSVVNKWHIDSRFKFATPEYLLKDDNLNRYLNFGSGNN